MSDDLRLIFVAKALYFAVELGEGLEAEDVDGLKQIIDAVVMDNGRGK